MRIVRIMSDRLHLALAAALGVVLPAAVAFIVLLAD
jgi:hypothetical protein